MWTGPWIGWGQAKRSWRGRIQEREKGRTGSLAPPSPPPFLAFSSLLSCPIGHYRTFWLKKQNKTKSSSHVLFVNSGHWFVTHVSNCKYTTSLCFSKRCIHLTSIALLLISSPDPLFVPRLGYVRCPFRLTIVELGTKLFIKRAQRALLQFLTVLWNDNPYLDWRSKGIYLSICLSFHSWLETTDMEFLDELTEGLDRVLMVRGGGREVITIYSWLVSSKSSLVREGHHGRNCFVAYVYVYKEADGSKVIYFCLSLPA